MSTTGEIKNLNVLALLVTQREGGKVNLSIAQVKEVIKVISQLMVERTEVMELMLKNGRKKR